MHKEKWFFMESTPPSVERSPGKVSAVATERKIAHVTDWLSEKKALDLLALSIPEKSCVAEAVVIVTASSIRHAQGLADSVLERCREVQYEFLRMEGFAVGEWILLDLNDVIVHIFQEETRKRYRLDDLWPEARVLAGERQERSL